MYVLFARKINGHYTGVFGSMDKKILKLMD